MPRWKDPNDDGGWFSEDGLRQRIVRQMRDGIAAAVEGCEGVDCPICDQFVKTYKRPLYGAMAAALIYLVRASQPEVNHGWVNRLDLPSISDRPGGPDGTKLKYWKLIELAEPDDRFEQNRSGLWRPTQRGIDFAHGKVTVPSHAYVYNDEPLRFTDKYIDIRKALGTKWDYAELMGWASA